MEKRFHKAALALAVSAVFYMPAGQAERWTIAPSIRGQATLSDNAALNPPGEEKGDFITEVEPGVFIDGEGDRLRLRFDARANMLRYWQETQDDRIDLRLNGRATVEAIENFFFVDARASVAQAYESALGPISIDSSTSDENNRFTSTSWSISPYIQGRLFGDGNYLVRNTHSWAEAGQSSVVGDVYTNSLNARAATPIRLFGAMWTYDRTRSEFDEDQEVETEIARAIGFLRFDPQFTLNARVGRERVNFLGEESDETIYGGGFDWRPTPRSRIDGYVEERIFGTGYDFNFINQRPLSTWRVHASRDLNSYPQTLANFEENADAESAFIDLQMNSSLWQRLYPDPVEREQAIRGEIDRQQISFLNVTALYAEQMIVQERLEGSVTLHGARNSLTFRAFANESEYFSDAVSNLLVESLLGRHIKQRGASVYWTHKLSPLTRWNLGVTRIHSEQLEPEESEGDSQQTSFRTTVSHDLSPRTNVYVGARYVIFNTDSEGTGSLIGNDYRETAIFAGITHRF